MTKRHLSLTVENEVYQEVKNNIPEGQVSNFVNDLLKKYLKEKKIQELKEAYQRTARSKIRQEEDKIWEGTIEDGIDHE